MKELIQYWPYAAGFLGLCLIIMMMLRVIVPPDVADVVIKRRKRRVYCSDPKINAAMKTTYYNIPSWVPFFGMFVKRIPLKVIEIKVYEYETFAQA